MTTTTNIDDRRFAVITAKLPNFDISPVTYVPVGHDNYHCPEIAKEGAAGTVLCKDKSLNDHLVENEFFDGEYRFEPVWPCKCVDIGDQPVAERPDPIIPEPEPTPSFEAAKNDEPSQDEQVMAIAREEATARTEKFTRADLTPELRRAAQIYADNYDGDFEFILKAKRYKHVPEGMMAGVLNTFRAECFRQRKSTPLATIPASNVILTLPSGKYDVADEDGVLTTVEIDQGTENWAGWTFVRIGGEKIGQQKPGESYRGKNVLVLQRLAEDPVAAAARYGHRTSNCGICGRHLEDPESVERGMGPVCWRRLRGTA